MGIVQGVVVEAIDIIKTNASLFGDVVSLVYLPFIIFKNLDVSGNILGKETGTGVQAVVHELHESEIL